MPSAVFNPPEGMEDLRRTYRISQQHGQDIQAVGEIFEKEGGCAGLPTIFFVFKAQIYL